MRLLLAIGILGFISTSLFAKTNVLDFNPTSNSYTNVVQDIAVFQEQCQKQSSGHYLSKMYEFYFHHDRNGNCIIVYGNDPIMFRVIMDDNAQHVIKNMTNINGDSVTCDVKMNNKGMDNYYTGACTIKN